MPEIPMAEQYLWAGYRPQAQGMTAAVSQPGIAPGGVRHSGEGVKGLGYFGSIPDGRGGYSTELSSEFELGGKTIEYPLLVPTLSLEEIKHLLSGAKPNDAIYRKAEQYAIHRISKGLSPFATPSDIRYPLPLR